jgi:hypothetical protein
MAESYADAATQAIESLKSVSLATDQLANGLDITATVKAAKKISADTSGIKAESDSKKEEENNENKTEDKILSIEEAFKELENS